jgi:glycosyltransferase involved in cell wall biosynthesis
MPNPVVMQILPALEQGGVERGTVEIASCLKKEGWESYVVSEGGRLVEELNKIGVEHIVLPVASKNPFKIIKNAFALKKLIEEKHIDIVHARSRAPAWSVWLAAKMAKVHFLTTFHGVYNIGGSSLKKKYNAVMTKGDLIIAVSNFVSNHIQENYGIHKSKIRVIPRGADIEKFSKENVSAERVTALAKQWGLFKEKPVIMLPGRLTRWKGQMVLLEALTYMKNKDIICVFVGSDQGRTAYREEMALYAEKYGLTDKIKMIEFCKDMPAAYCLSDIVVCPSTDPEAFGRVIPEAQAMGCLVVASNHGGATETIENGKTGFRTPVGDSRDLSRVLDFLIEMPIYENQKISQAAIQSVRNEFSVQKMCLKTLEVYKELSEMPLDKA